MGHRTAFVSDIHGNVTALAAVLEDIKRRGVDKIYNAGDTLYGPLDPFETYALLLQNPIVHIAGNGDRELLEKDDGSDGTMNRLRRSLSNEHKTWLREMRSTHMTDDFYLCHGTPDSDTSYLLEEMSPAGAVLKNPAEIDRTLAKIKHPVIVCGHTHIPRTIRLPSGKIVVNPGSVGLPSYYDDLPVAHKMESGSPHAKYAILEKQGGQYLVEQICVPYDWDGAAKTALLNDRPDWSFCLKTGRAEP